MHFGAAEFVETISSRTSGVSCYRPIGLVGHPKTAMRQHIVQEQMPQIGDWSNEDFQREIFQTLAGVTTGG